MNNIEIFIEEMKDKYEGFGFGISNDVFEELCSHYNINLVKFIFPYYTYIEKNEKFYCKDFFALDQMQTDWNYVKTYLEKTSEEIAFMNITIEEYFPQIEKEFYEYKHFTKEDILFSYQQILTKNKKNNMIFR